MKLKLIVCCIMVNVLVINPSLYSGTDHMNTSEKSFQKTGFYLLTEKDRIELATEEATQLLTGKQFQAGHMVQLVCSKKKLICSIPYSTNHRILFVGSDSSDTAQAYILCKLKESDTARLLSLQIINGYKTPKVVNGIPFDIRFAEAGICEIIPGQKLQKGTYCFVKESQYLPSSKKITIHCFTID